MIILPLNTGLYTEAATPAGRSRTAPLPDKSQNKTILTHVTVGCGRPGRAQWRRRRLVPDFEEAVPGSCADRHAVLGDAQTADPIVVAGQHAWSGDGDRSDRVTGRWGHYRFKTRSDRIT